MKKRWLLLVSLVLSLFTYQANAINSVVLAQSEDASQTVDVASSPGPYTDLFVTYVQPILEESGYEVVIHDFTELLLANESVLEGSTDLNVEQHLLYMENFNEERDGNLVSLGSIPTLPASLYGGRKSSLEEVAEGDIVSIPEDASNLTRALLILEKAGWITLDPEVEPGDVELNDIIENPYNLEIVTMASLNIPPTLPDVDYAVIPGSIAYDAEITSEQALLNEDLLPELYLQLVVREDQADAEWAQIIRGSYDSEEVQAGIKENAETEDINWVIPE